MINKKPCLMTMYISSSKDELRTGHNYAATYSTIVNLYDAEDIASKIDNLDTINAKMDSWLFKLKDMGSRNYYSGIRIERTSKTIEIDGETYYPMYSLSFDEEKLIQFASKYKEV